MSKVSRFIRILMSNCGTTKILSPLIGESKTLSSLEFLQLKEGWNSCNLLACCSSLIIRHFPPSNSQLCLERHLMGQSFRSIKDAVLSHFRFGVIGFRHNSKNSYFGFGMSEA
ncbi:hypothetical protein AVEN_189067-1 [Araneus ventricosus]|uniref:Uncharacterized protein n=1 Tax=Araneus ventricosus TaxID=182803 RepID=A0A4Y2JK02_ARAVE|nr:hypothetical protein AVEN_189067-1 [Araneus ventricosus]